MDFNEYQKEAHKTAQYNGVKNEYLEQLSNREYYNYVFDLIDESGYRVYAPLYPFLKIHQEASEISEPIIKRRFRGDKKEIMKSDLLLELGDTLWYVSECATQLGISLNDIAESNIVKLSDRAKRNVIKGSGDNR